MLLAALVVVSLASGFARSLGAPWLPSGLTALDWERDQELGLTLEVRSVPIFDQDHWSAIE